MILEIARSEIIKGLIKQLTSFFSISDDEMKCLEANLQETLSRSEFCFSKSSNKYYKKNGEVYFNPYHSGQNTIFLYFLSNCIYINNPEKLILADKLYYLNKIMNSCDLFYGISLPEIFALDHPVGSVMGRAKYSNYFAFGQNCTVGNNMGVYPVIDAHVSMASHSMILGNSKIGSNVIIGAGACVKDQDIPNNSMVFGSSPNLIIKKNPYSHG